MADDVMGDDLAGGTRAVKRFDLATDDRGVAAAAIEDAFGFRTRINGRRISYRQQTVANDDLSFTELRFGAGLRTEVGPNPSFVVSEVPRGATSCDAVARRPTSRTAACSCCRRDAR